MTETADIASPSVEEEEAPDAELPKMSFLDHLEELRKRLIVSIIAIFVAFLACWRYADKIYAWVQAPLTKFLPPGDQKLAYTHLTEPFMVYMKVAFFAAIFIASPIIMWQVWRFISPRLFKREGPFAAPFLLPAAPFFFVGRDLRFPGPPAGARPLLLRNRPEV